MSDNTAASNLDWTNIAITAGIALGAAALSCVGHAAITAYAMKSSAEPEKKPAPKAEPQPAPQPTPEAAAKPAAAAADTTPPPATDSAA